MKEENNNLQMRIIDANGKEKLVDMLCTFKCEELNKDYLAVTDWTYSENDELNITLLYYTPGSDVTRLKPVTNPDELQMAYDILDELRNITEANEKKGVK